MNTAMSRNAGLQALKRESARLKMDRALRQRADLAAELLALDQITVSEALDMSFSRTAEEYLNRSETVKREKKLQLLILTTIEGIDMPLAEDLINEFGSLEAIAEATPEKLEIVPGIDKNKAEKIVKEVSKLVSQM